MSKISGEIYGKITLIQPLRRTRRPKSHPYPLHAAASIQPPPSALPIPRFAPGHRRFSTRLAATHQRRPAASPPDPHKSTHTLPSPAPFLIRRRWRAAPTPSGPRPRRWPGTTSSSACASLPPPNSSSPSRGQRPSPPLRSRSPQILCWARTLDSVRGVEIRDVGLVQSVPPCAMRAGSIS